MERTLRLSLNNFVETPPPLIQSPPTSGVREEISINLANLYHQYYLDSYDVAPPDPDPAHFEHLRFLSAEQHFRLRGDGLGVHPGIRRHRSNELGQAFCRVFLHDYLGITYFAHIAHVIGRTAAPAFQSVRVERTEDGDAPDYLCASGLADVFLAEAKGRYPSVSFDSREFDSWRKQFCRIVVKDLGGRARAVKGFIVATRFATESQPRVKSGIFAEDPNSPGDGVLDSESSANLRRHVVAAHYGQVASKLAQPVLAAALQTGFVLPDEIQFPAVIWELRLGPLEGTRFVGGYYSPQGNLPVQEHNGRFFFGSSNPFRLDVGLPPRVRQIVKRVVTVRW